MDAQLMPMLCGKTDVVDHAADRWVMEPKIDGWRAITHVTGGQVLTFARSGAAYHGKCPHIDAALLSVLPDDTVLDGEFSGAAGWGDVQGVMTRHANNGTLLSYVIFDVIRVAGLDARSMPWDSRRELLAKIEDHRSFALPLIINPAGEPDQATADAMIAAGAEGVVLKRRDSRYTNGRSNMWQKYKPKASLTEEAEVIGFKPGEKGGKFDGMVGAFKCRMLATGAETTVKCGVDERHRDATDHPERWLGTIIEISHHGIGKTGKPRHPQFERRRDDMAPASTTTKETKVSTSTKSAREKQVAAALRQMPDREKQVERFTSGRNQATGKPRNYAAMGAAKLLRCISELESGAGEAYNKALNASGNPEADLELAREAARAKGLI